VGQLRVADCPLSGQSATLVSWTGRVSIPLGRVLKALPATEPRPVVRAGPVVLSHVRPGYGFAPAAPVKVLAAGAYALLMTHSPWLSLVHRPRHSP
jgi:hypothetical protein